MNRSYKKRELVFVFRPDNNPSLIAEVRKLEKQSYWLFNQLLERLYQKKQLELTNKTNTPGYIKNDYEVKTIEELLKEKRKLLRRYWKSYTLYSIDDSRAKTLLEPQEPLNK